MLIAQLTRYYPFGGSECLYAACDPFDHEQLTQWHETILQVDEDLMSLPQQWGLNIAAYEGESDVPARPVLDEDEDTKPEPLITLGILAFGIVPIGL